MYQMRNYGRISYGRFLCISKKWMEWETYTRDQFRRTHRGSRARRHKASPRGRRCRGCDSEIPLRHTRCLDGVSRGVEKETEEMQHEVMVLSKHMHERMFRQKTCAGCTLQQEWMETMWLLSLSMQMQRRCCTQNYHHQCRKSRETYIECMHIFAYNQQRAVLKSGACRLQTAVLYQNRRPHISVQEKKLALPRHCGFDSYSALTKMRCPSWLGKLLQSNSASLFLSFCLLGIVWSSVKAQSTKKSS